ncbi:hypothetical protein Tco_1578424 [Tanacetum coccineum]
MKSSAMTSGFTTVQASNLNVKNVVLITTDQASTSLFQTTSLERIGSSLAPQCQQKFIKQLRHPSACTTSDASNKRQQQPDSTSSTSTLATTVTANGNFDL